MRAIAAHTGDIRAVSLKGNQRAISVGDDGVLAIWDLTTGDRIATLKGHTAPIRALAVTADDAFAVSGSDDLTVKLWDLERHCEVHSFIGHDHPVIAVNFASDGKRLFSVSSHQEVKAWDIETRGEGFTVYPAGQEAFGTALSPDCNWLITSLGDGVLRFLNLNDDSQSFNQPWADPNTHVMTLRVDSRILMLIGADGTLVAFDVRAGRPVASFTADDHLRCCAFALNSGTIAAGERSGRVHFLRLQGP